MGLPTSGYISIAWQLRVGDFAVTWQDTAGPIRSGPGLTHKSLDGQVYDGAPITAALETLPQTDVRLGAVVVSKSVTIDHLRALHFPKVFIPLHGDPCFARSRVEIQQYIEEKLPPTERPRLRLLADPWMKNGC